MLVLCPLAWRHRRCWLIRFIEWGNVADNVMISRPRRWFARPLNGADDEKTESTVWLDRIRGDWGHQLFLHFSASSSSSSLLLLLIFFETIHSFVFCFAFVLEKDNYAWRLNWFIKLMPFSLLIGFSRASARCPLTFNYQSKSKRNSLPPRPFSSSSSSSSSCPCPSPNDSSSKESLKNPSGIPRESRVMSRRHFYCIGRF